LLAGDEDAGGDGINQQRLRIARAARIDARERGQIGERTRDGCIGELHVDRRFGCAVHADVRAQRRVVADVTDVEIGDTAIRPRAACHVFKVYGHDTGKGVASQQGALLGDGKHAGTVAAVVVRPQDAWIAAAGGKA